MTTILEDIKEAKEDLEPKVKNWQTKIARGQQQTVTCIYNKKLRCTLTVPSVACLKCEHYGK